MILPNTRNNVYGIISREGHRFTKYLCSDNTYTIIKHQFQNFPPIQGGSFCCLVCIEYHCNTNILMTFIYFLFFYMIGWSSPFQHQFFVILRERVIGNHASKYFHSRRSMSVSPSMQCIFFTSIDTCNISKRHMRARVLLECTRLSREYQMTC